MNSTCLETNPFSQDICVDRLEQETLTPFLEVLD